MPSTRFTLNIQDIQKWTINLRRFLAPLLLIYLYFVISQIKTNGFNWSDFVPTIVVQGSMTLYILNGFTDLLVKFIQGPTN